MATLKMGQVVADIRGKIGGTVFSRNKGGSYARQFIKPINPNSARQASNRSIFGSLMSEWRDLSEADRAAWEQAAPNYPAYNKVGDKIVYSGSQLYCRCNMSLISAGEPKVATIPSSPVPVTGGGAKKTPPPWQTLAGDLSELSELVLTLPTGNIEQTERVVVYMSPPMSPGVKSVRTPSYRRIGSYGEPDVNLTGADGAIRLLADWEAVFGSPVVKAGQAVLFSKVFIMDVGTGFLMPYGSQRIEVVEGTPPT